MHLKITDQVGSQLSGAMECSLPPPKCFVEFCLAVAAEVGYLRRGQGAEFAAAAGVGWGGLEGQEGWCGGRDAGGRGFVVEVSADVVGL